MEKIITIENLSKQYKLGAIGGETLSGEILNCLTKLRSKKNSDTAIEPINNTHNKKFWALKNLNLDVYKGDTLGIIGLNGAGKSTLLKILSRVTAPTEGEITIDGRISSMLEVGTGFHGELTGRENIYLNGAILGMSKKEINNKIEQIIDFSECRPFIDTPVKRYSSGMYVKLAFAVAAHLDSEILIMDEVLAVGDMKFQEKCLNKMGDVAEHDDKTVLYVSHNMNTIRKLCNRCIVLEHGQKISDGNVEDAIKLYSNKTVELKKDYDLTTEYPGITKKIDFLHFSYSNKIGYEVTSSDTLDFYLYIKSYVNSKNIHIRFILRWEDDTPVGTFISEHTDIQKDAVHKFHVSLPLKSFPDGRYYIRITMSSVNSFGTHEDLGRCEKAAYFIVKNSSAIYYNLDWINWGWGAFLGNVKLEEE